MCIYIGYFFIFSQLQKFVMRVGRWPTVRLGWCTSAVIVIHMAGSARRHVRRCCEGVQTLWLPVCLTSLPCLGLGKSHAHRALLTDCMELYVFRRIAEGLESSLPNLETLVLTGNLIQELADLDPLASIKSLRTLSLLHNPVTTRQHYRLYVAFKLPQLRLLDFRKIKVKVSGQCLRKWCAMEIHFVSMELDALSCLVSSLLVRNVREFHFWPCRWSLFVFI